MVTTSRSSLISFTVCVFGRLTSIPDCRIGAVIMKMISNTSITSTKGTILISEREVPVWRASCGICLYHHIDGVVEPKKAVELTAFFRLKKVLQIILLDQRRDFHREIIHARAHLPNIVHEMVIRNHRWDRRKQPRRRRDQRLSDTRSHHAQARRPGCPQPGEGIHHAPHRPE